MMRILSPARDYIILELEESKYTGTLIIPEAAKDAPSTGIVVAVGPGEYDKGDTISLVTKVGDRILFPKYSGSDFEWEGKKLLLMRESEIIAYIKETK